MPNTPAPQRITLSEWINAFLVDRRSNNLAPTTILYYRNKLNLLMRYCQVHHIDQVEPITPVFLREFFIQLSPSHNPGGVHAVFRSVKAFLLWFEKEAEPDDWKNPIRKVKAPKVGVEPLAPVEFSTVEALIAACPHRTLTGERDRAMFMALLDTGARATEFLSVDLVDVNLATGEMLIRQGKGRKPREAYLSARSRRALRAYLKLRTDDCPALWITQTGMRLRYDGLRAVVTTHSQQAGIKPPELHAFRRAFALHMLRSGVDVFTLQLLMGHSSLYIMRRYLAQNKNDTAAAHHKSSPVEELRL